MEDADFSYLRVGIKPFPDVKPAQTYVFRQGVTK